MVSHRPTSIQVLQNLRYYLLLQTHFWEKNNTNQASANFTYMITKLRERRTCFRGVSFSSMQVSHKFIHDKAHGEGCVIINKKSDSKIRGGCTSSFRIRQHLASFTIIYKIYDNHRWSRCCGPWNPWNRLNPRRGTLSFVGDDAGADGVTWKGVTYTEGEVEVVGAPFQY